MTVDKVGRTTGWTRGVQTVTCADAFIEDHVVLCSHRVEWASGGTGDSGAPVFGVDGSTIYFLGVLFATAVNGPGPEGTLQCNNPTGPPPDDRCSYWYSDDWAISFHLGRNFSVQ